MLRGTKVGFGRGLCVINDRAVATVTSPATINLYNLKENSHLFSVDLTHNVSTAIHDITLWRFWNIGVRVNFPR